MTVVILADDGRYSPAKYLIINLISAFFMSDKNIPNIYAFKNL